MSNSYVRPNLTHTLCFMFSGKAGTGKSYWSDKFQNFLNKNGFKTFKSPLAYGVKETATFMGWDGKKDQRGRRLLQRTGQMGREYDEYLWVRNSFTRVEESVGYPYDAIFIDDWRFENEYKYILSNERLYKPIRIRIEAEDRELLVGTPEYDEISETELDDFEFDYTLPNHTQIVVVDESLLFDKWIRLGTDMPLNGAFSI